MYYLATTNEQPEAPRAMAPLITTSNYYHAPWRYQGGVFELGLALLWSLGMASEELRQANCLM